jgi:hypothetical protein
MITEIRRAINAGERHASYSQEAINMLEELIQRNLLLEVDVIIGGPDPVVIGHSQNDYSEEQTLRSKLSGRLAVGAASGFVVIGSSIRAETPDEKSASALGIRHVDIFYNGAIIRVGKGGGVDRAYQNTVTDKSLWFDTEVTPLVRLKNGDAGFWDRNAYVMEAGSAKGKCCKDVTDAEIVDCVKKYPAYDVNCQADVVGATFGCCLRGYEGWGALQGVKSANYQGYIYDRMLTRTAGGF